MTLSSRHEDKNGNLFGMDAQGDALDDMRVEASGILQMQYERGNNGFVKRKYVTLTIEAENLPAARARFSRIEADTLNRFKVMGAGARVLDGKERLPEAKTMTDEEAAALLRLALTSEPAREFLKKRAESGNAE